MPSPGGDPFKAMQLTIDALQAENERLNDRVKYFEQEHWPVFNALQEQLSDLKAKCKALAEKWAKMEVRHEHFGYVENDTYVFHGCADELLSELGMKQNVP